MWDLTTKLSDQMQYAIRHNQERKIELTQVRAFIRKLLMDVNKEAVRVAEAKLGN